jgi:polygalacturonase
MKLLTCLKFTCHVKNLIILFFIIIILPFNGFTQNSTLNICDFGADNTGKVNSSSLINHLIDSLSNKNGGTIFFPAGDYICGPIIMKSNITLQTDAGAVIHFTDNFNDYLPMVISRWEEVRVKNFISPIYAIDAENISIKGEGHFEGHGKKWWDFWFSVRRDSITNSEWQQIFARENKELLSRNKYLPKMKNFLRPPMVLFYHCKNVLIEDVSFSNPPFWTIVPVFSENVTIENVTIENPGNSPNTDGIDPSSCRNVRISDCHISVGDDCIVLKSGRDEDGREADAPTENIAITNCTMLNGHGGVVIGSEMSGDVRRVTISNCIFEGTDRGIRLKTMRGRGGIVEDIRVSNIVMHNIVEEGITLNMRYQPTSEEPLTERTPAFRKIHFSNISIVNAKKGITLYGLEERNIDQITFNDISIQSEIGIISEYADNLNFNNIVLETKSEEPIRFNNCDNIIIDQLQLLNPPIATNAILLNKCNSVKISNCFQPEKISSFLKADNPCKNIYLINNILPGVEKIISTQNKTKNIKQINNSN